MTGTSKTFRTGTGHFFAFAFTWSLLFWWLTARSGGIAQFPGSILQYLGGAGPIVAALVLTHFWERPEIQRDFWVRTLDPRRMSLTWIIVALTLHPALVGAACLVDIAMGGELSIKWQLFANPMTLVSLVFFVFVFGPLPEEMGWRGIVLDRLQERMSALNASWILAIAWALWHVPLFFIEGTYQNGLGVGSRRFWIFFADLVPLTIIITWVYNHTNRSTLSAVLVHFSGNMCGALMIKSDRLAALEFLCLAIAAVAMITKSGSSLGTPKQFPG